MSKMYYHEQCDEMLEDGLTTIMLRRVPPEMTMASLLAFLDGFAAGKYDFVYLPFDRRKEMNIALAFVNFVDPPSARMAFTLLVSGVFESMSNVRVSAANVQGFSTNLAYFIARFGLQAVLQPNAPVVLQAGQVIDVQLAIAMHVTQDLLREAHKLVQAERMGHGQEGSVRRSKRFMWKNPAATPVLLESTRRHRSNWRTEVRHPMDAPSTSSYSQSSGEESGQRVVRPASSSQNQKLVAKVSDEVVLEGGSFKQMSGKLVFCL